MTENVIKMFGEAAVEHQNLFGTKNEHFAFISYKNHSQSTFNPYALNQTYYDFNTILDQKRALYGPLTLYQACPVANGAACAILCNEKFLQRNPQLIENAVEIVGQTIVSDLPSSFGKDKKRFFSFFPIFILFFCFLIYFFSFIDLCGYQLCKKGAEIVFKQSGLNPSLVNVVEVHDCFSSNELMMYEALGLCEEGKGSELIELGRWINTEKGGQLFQMRSSSVNGRWVVNPSGGLESKGHPLGATGIAQCAELCWQVSTFL